MAKKKDSLIEEAEKIKAELDALKKTYESSQTELQESKNN